MAVTSVGKYGSSCKDRLKPAATLRFSIRPFHAEEEPMPLSKGEIRDPEFEPPKEEVKEVLFIQKGLTDLGFKPVTWK